MPAGPPPQNKNGNSCDAVSENEAKQRVKGRNLIGSQFSVKH